MIRVGNAGRSVPWWKSLLNYIFHLNKSERVIPSFVLRSFDPVLEKRDHRSEFDVWKIPSDVLLRDVKEVGFQVVYFSTWPYPIKPSLSISAKQLFRTIVAYLPFFPFTHMGPTSIIVAQKPV